MKKELWLHTDSYRPNGDAPANRSYAFATYFSSKGFSVNVITIGPKDVVEERPEAKVYYLKNSFHYKKKNLLNRLADNFLFAKKTTSLLKKHKKDLEGSFFLVSVPEYLSGITCIKAKKYGSKLIVDVRDIWPEVAIEMGSFSPRSLMAYVFRWCAKKYYSSCDYLLTVSQNKVKHLKEITHHKMDEKILYVGNGFDLSTKQVPPDCSLLPEVFADSSRFVLSYVGNVGKAQHLLPLLQFAKTLDPQKFTFVIAGKGADLENLKSFAHENQMVNVFFTGQVSREQAIGLMIQSDAAYIPLVSDAMIDSVPTKLFDALAYGVPVVLVANGESVDILERSKLGVHLLPSHIDQLPCVFEEFLNNYDRILANKENAIHLIENEYSREKFCEALYLELTKGAKEEK